MKFGLKHIAVAIVAIGVSGVADVTANALTLQETRELRRDLRDAISDLIVDTELQMDAIDEALKGDLPREQERALLKERRMLSTEIRRLKIRRNQVFKWRENQLNYWAGIYIPDEVSPT